MVERVARRIWDRRRALVALAYPELLPLEPWGDGTIPKANWIMEEAQAAIEAMREPTDAMSHAPTQTGGEPYSGPSPRIFAEAWRMMIEEALK